MVSLLFAGGHVGLDCIEKSSMDNACWWRRRPRFQDCKAASQCSCPISKRCADDVLWTVLAAPGTTSVCLHSTQEIAESPRAFHGRNEAPCTQSQGPPWEDGEIRLICP